MHLPVSQTHTHTLQRGYDISSVKQTDWTGNHHWKVHKQSSWFLYLTPPPSTPLNLTLPEKPKWSWRLVYGLVLRCVWSESLPTHACVDTHAHTRSEREGEPALAVIAEMINKRLRFNPEGFSASHTTEEEGGKSRGGEPGGDLVPEGNEGWLGGGGRWGWHGVILGESKVMTGKNRERQSNLQCLMLEWVFRGAD